MTTAVGAHDSQTVSLLVMGDGSSAALQTTQVVELVVYAPPSTRYARTEQAVALLPLTPGADVMARVEQEVLLVVYTSGTPDQSRSQAWWYVQDGHTFYVLNIGEEGTFLFDTTTQQWCKFTTAGYNFWNMQNGCMWGNRVVAGDTISSLVWEFDPTTTLDDGWRDLAHTVTGAIALRSRQGVGCATVRLTASVGILDEVNGGTISLSYSDDWGDTWKAPRTLNLAEAAYGSEIAWRSLGSFASPGRIFKITDVGGIVRIDAAAAYLNNFDDDAIDKQTAADGDA